MNVKKEARLRRSRKARAKIREIGATRLTIFRTPRHIYAQVISPCGKTILAAASTLDKEVRAQIQNGGNVDAAQVVGKVVAERALKANIISVAFDRAGFQYHGRIKALADSAREAGLQF